MLENFQHGFISAKLLIGDGHALCDDKASWSVVHMDAGTIFEIQSWNNISWTSETPKDVFYNRCYYKTIKTCGYQEACWHVNKPLRPWWEAPPPCWPLPVRGVLSGSPSINRSDPVPAQGCPGTCLCGTSKEKAEKRIPVCCSEYKSVTGALQRQFGLGVMKWGNL